MALQLYGQFADYYSIGNISRAIARIFKQKHIPFSVWSTQSFGELYKNCMWRVTHNATAKVGVCVGYPTSALGWLKNHEKKVLVTVCETTKIPEEWLDVCRQVDKIIVPSPFVRQSFIDSGVRTPIVVAYHGVDHRMLRMRQIPTSLPPQQVKFLHVTGAISFPQRKGTPQLLGAMHLITRKHKNVHLTIKTQSYPGLLKRIKDLDLSDYVTIDETKSLDPIDMGNYLQRFDAVIQPSRGEGFGMVPLEARCLGIPCILTAVTGHQSHFAPGVDIEVQTGPYTLMTSQANEVGAAPSLTAQQVADGIETFLSDIQGFKERTFSWAERFADNWSWSRTLSPLMWAVETDARKRDRSIRFGQSIGLRGV